MYINVYILCYILYIYVYIYIYIIFFARSRMGDRRLKKHAEKKASLWSHCVWGFFIRTFWMWMKRTRVDVRFQSEFGGWFRNGSWIPRGFLSLKLEHAKGSIYAGMSSIDSLIANIARNICLFPHGSMLIRLGHYCSVLWIIRDVFYIQPCLKAAKTRLRNGILIMHSSIHLALLALEILMIIIIIIIIIKIYLAKNYQI